MTNGRFFNTGNHPVEMLVPLRHMMDAGFGVEIATPSGKPAGIEMWAFPKEDVVIGKLYKKLELQLKRPLKFSEIDESLEAYAAIFIPGGHGTMIDLPHNRELGEILRSAHELSLPTISICHGPAALLSAAIETETDGTANFPYAGYEYAAFPDLFDKVLPTLGYMPGNLKWYQNEALQQRQMKQVNFMDPVRVHVFKELITGAAPEAAHKLGLVATAKLLKVYE
jgi:D-lactate dehydratase / protein deglycase